MANSVDERLSAGDKLRAARNRVSGAGDKVSSAGDRMKAARDRVSAAGNRVGSAGDRVSNAGQMIKGSSTAAGWPGNVGSNLDSRILNPEQENQAAGDLREKKKGGEEPGEAGEPSLRERVMAAKKALNLKEQAQKKIEATVTAPAKQGTSWLLKMSWLNLIDSFGLTLIYINIHVFLKWVLGEKLFCKLGEEWLPKQIKEAGGEAGNTAGRGIGLVEVMVLLVLDLIVLCAIGVVLALIVMIVDFMQAGFMEKAKMAVNFVIAMIGGLTNLSWAGIKALYDLFANL